MSQAREHPMQKQQHSHRGSHAPVAFGWVQRKHDDGRLNGRFDYYLIRQCPVCHHTQTQQLIFVDPEFLTCLSCLSQNVEILKHGDYTSGDAVKVRCLDCKVVSEVEFTAGDVEEPEEDDEYRGWQPGDDDD